MGKLFDPNNPVMVFFGKVADMLVANLLWFICSIPIVTIGASTSALYYMCFRLLKGEEGNVIKTFFREFRSNFKQATAIWLLLLLAASALTYNIVLAVQSALYEETFGLIVMGVLAICSILAMTVLIFAFALQSYFNNTLKNTLINATIFGLSNIVPTVVMIVCDVAMMVFGIIYCPLLVPVAPIMINAIMMKPIFVKYHSKEENQADVQPEDASSP